MTKVVTLGEVMLRLSPEGHGRFLQADRFVVTVGGAEANVAVALARFGLESHFITKLPSHEIGQLVVDALRRYGVREDAIVRGGDRVGIYYVETGASQRPSKVIYDRRESAMATLGADEVDLERVFEGARWFHFSGITPALDPALADRTREACHAARAAGATVSCDLNFRAKLWSEAQAREVMPALMEWVDVCLANEEDADKCLGLTAERSDVGSAELDVPAYLALARRMREAYGFQAVAITLRESHSASRNGWSAVLVDDRECREGHRSRHYDIAIVDRVGGGDSFASGLIYGLLTKEDSREALEFAVAASTLKQTIPGDFNLVSTEEIEKLARGGGAGRVER